jgi:hypothetical protein
MSDTNAAKYIRTCSAEIDNSPEVDGGLWPNTDYTYWVGF